jgi:hypothetical protein
MAKSPVSRYSRSCWNRASKSPGSTLPESQEKPGSRSARSAWASTDGIELGLSPLPVTWAR